VEGKGHPATCHDWHSGGAEVWLYSRLISAIDKGEW